MVEQAAGPASPLAAPQGPERRATVEKGFVSRLIRRFVGYASCWWYSPMLALLAALDAYIIFVPNEALLIPAVLSRPSKWLRITLWMSLGSALGATSFAVLTSHYGAPFLERLHPHLFESHAWRHATHFINETGGAWGLALVSFSPLPQHAAVAIMGLAHTRWTTVLVAVFVGRMVKYALVAWCAVHAPGVLRKLGILPGGKSDKA